MGDLPLLSLPPLLKKAREAAERTRADRAIEREATHTPRAVKKQRAESRRERRAAGACSTKQAPGRAQKTTKPAPPPRGERVPPKRRSWDAA
jgi:hypothetical protein